MLSLHNSAEVGLWMLGKDRGAFYLVSVRFTWHRFDPSVSSSISKLQTCSCVHTFLAQQHQLSNRSELDPIWTISSSCCVTEKCSSVVILDESDRKCLPDWNHHKTFTDRKERHFWPVLSPDWGLSYADAFPLIINFTTTNPPESFDTFFVRAAVSMTTRIIE